LKDTRLRCQLLRLARYASVQHAGAMEGRSNHI
jgi:hypothetical protein